MADQQRSPAPARFEIPEVIAAFPEHAETLLLDRYLVDHETASARVFRVYRSTPPHFHRNCDEHLYVLSGRGTFWMEDASNGGEFGPGTFLFFGRGTVHAMPELTEQPVVFLAIDTPRRDPADVVFVESADGTAASFIQPLARGPDETASGV